MRLMRLWASQFQPLHPYRWGRRHRQDLHLANLLLKTCSIWMRTFPSTKNSTKLWRIRKRYLNFFQIIFNNVEIVCAIVNVKRVGTRLGSGDGRVREYFLTLGQRSRVLLLQAQKSRQGRQVCFWTQALTGTIFLILVRLTVDYRVRV